MEEETMFIISTDEHWFLKSQIESLGPLCDDQILGVSHPELPPLTHYQSFLESSGLTVMTPLAIPHYWWELRDSALCLASWYVCSKVSKSKVRSEEPG